MVFTFFWIRVNGFDAFLHQGWWFRCFSGLGLVVLTLSWIRVAGFNAFLD